MMKRLWFINLLGLALFCSSVHVTAQLREVPRTDGMLYYKIGGGRHITIPPSLTVTNISFSASAGLTGLNCGEFDLAASVEASLDQLSQGWDDAMIAIEAAASAAIANLPGYLLQKANPGLYDIFQNALLRAQEAYSLATKSCERMQYEISNNINPYSEWITLSRGDSWKRSIGAGEENIHEAEEEAVDGHNDGFTWLGGIQRGGQGQPPVRIISEVASAGLNILSSRPSESQQNIPSNSPFHRYFAGPDDVSDWVREILGDILVSVCDGCDKGAVPGKGLMAHIEDKADNIVQDLINLVTGSAAPTRSNLESVSAPGVEITYQVIKAIQNQTPDERGIIVNKLAQEIAEARTMEEAMVIRRLLLTGKKDSDVAAIEMAVDEIDKAIVELDNEIENVIFEKRVRSQLITNTVIEVLKQDNAQRQIGISTPPVLPTDNNPLRRGSVDE